MKKFLFLLLILIPLLKAWEFNCPAYMYVCCELFVTGPMYNYMCVCHPFDFPEYMMPRGYKKIKRCTDDSQKIKCYQNNIYSPQIDCECYN